MKLLSPNNISFQKTLRATCSILNNGRSEECHIFHLDSDEDRDYFDPLLLNKDWRNQRFLDIIQLEIGTPRQLGDFYVMENNRHKCLGYCQIDHDDSKTDEVLLIETMPTAASDCSTRKRKYIGETMMAFIVKNAINKGKEVIKVLDAIPDAFDFYHDVCGFKKSGQRTFELEDMYADAFIRANEDHTKKQIEFSN